MALIFLAAECMMPARDASKSATMLGILALVAWSSSALIVVQIQSLPLFQTQSIVFGISFLLAIFRYRLQLFTSIRDLPLSQLIIGIMGIYCNSAFFIHAFEHAPPEKVDLVNYLWPALVILGAYFLPKEKGKVVHIIGVIIAFLGVSLLLTQGEGWKGFEFAHAKGYMFAFLSALSWAVYTLNAIRHKTTSSIYIGIFCGFGFLFATVLHLYHEVYVPPSGTQWVALAIIGVATQGLAYYFWDTGVKKGNYSLLCILSYINPLVSIGWLILFGYSSLTTLLAISTCLVCLGALITTEVFEPYFETIKLRYSAFFKRPKWLLN